jgi:hypothetical protein
MEQETAMPERCLRAPRLSRRATCTRALAVMLGGLGLLGSRRAAAQVARSSSCLETVANESEAARQQRATNEARRIVVPAFLVGGGQPVDPNDIAALASVIEPAVAYILDPSKTTADAAVDKTIENALYAALSFQFPLYNLVVTGGKFTIGGGLYATEQLLVYGHDAQVLAILKGTEDAPLAGRIGNPLADAPLEDYSGMVSRGATLENLGEKFPKAQDLKTMWTGYVTQMWDARLNTSTRAYLETQIWPMVEKLWMAQRLAIAEADIRAELKRQLELLCKPEGVGGLYRGQILGELIVSPDAWVTSDVGATAVLVRSVSAEIRIAPTSQLLEEGMSQHQITGGAIAYHAEVTYDTYVSGTWIFEESFESFAPRGGYYTSPDGAAGYVEFPGNLHVRKRGSASVPPSTQSYALALGFIFDGARQLRLCPVSFQQTDLKGARQDCAANSFMTLQPVADEASP